MEIETTSYRVLRPPGDYANRTYVRVCICDIHSMHTREDGWEKCGPEIAYRLEVYRT